MSEQLQLVPLDQKDLTGRDAYRKWTKAGRQIYGIAFESIKIRPNFNKRIQFGDLDELGESINAAGLIEPLTVDALADGTFMLVDGERRYLAIQRLRDKGNNQFDHVEAHIVNKKTTDYERYVIMVAKNNLGKPLEDIELGNAFKEMLNDVDPLTGKQKIAADIARSTGYSKMHVSNMLRLAGINQEVKDAVNQGKLSPTAALEMDKQNLPVETQMEKIHDAESEGKKLQVKDVKEGNTKHPAIDGWEQVKGEEVVVSKKELRKHVGRVFSMPVYRGWSEDFIDEDTGETVSIDRREVMFPEGKIFEAEHIEDLIEAGVKIVRFQKVVVDIPESKPLEADEVMSEENNAKMDEEELQQAGLFGKNDKPKSTTLIDLAVETSAMLKGLWHHLSNIEEKLGSDHLEELDLAKEMATRLGVHVGQMKVIAENLKA